MPPTSYPPNPPLLQLINCVKFTLSERREEGRRGSTGIGAANGGGGGEKGTPTTDSPPCGCERGVGEGVRVGEGDTPILFIPLLLSPLLLLLLLQFPSQASDCRGWGGIGEVMEEVVEVVGGRARGLLAASTQGGASFTRSPTRAESFQRE